VYIITAVVVIIIIIITTIIIIIIIIIITGSVRIWSRKFRSGTSCLGCSQK